MEDLEKNLCLEKQHETSPFVQILAFHLLPLWPVTKLPKVAKAVKMEMKFLSLRLQDNNWDMKKYLAHNARQ